MPALKDNFNPSAEAIINFYKARLCARCARAFLKTEWIPLSWRLAKSWNSRCYWRCLVSWQVLFQQRELRLPWRFSNNSEIQYGCGECRVQLFDHKVLFTLKEHVKTTKIDKTHFLFAVKLSIFLPDKEMFLNAHFNQAIVKKRFVCGQQSSRDYWRCVLSKM